MIAPIGAQAERSRTTRIVGIDVARAVAIVGMFAIHFNLAADGSRDVTEATVGGGRSLLDLGFVAGPAAVSVGFVMVAGIGLALHGERAGRQRTVARLLSRTLVLLPLGLALQELFPDGVSVILQNFAVLFFLAIWLEQRSDRTLLLVAGASILGGAVLHMVVEAAYPAFVDGDQTRLVASPWRTLHGLLLTGPYPVVEFLGPFALGLWMGRRDLLDPRRQRRWFAVALGIGVAATVVGLVALAAVGPDSSLLARLAADITIDSKSLLWLVNGTAWQVVILVACLWAGEYVPRAVSPLAAMGQLSLTVYVLHLLVIAVDPDTMRTTSLVGAGTRALLSTAFFAPASMLWLDRVGRGPLEVAMDGPSRWFGPRPAG